MNSWSDKVGMAVASITLICCVVGLPILVMKYQSRVDECHAKGGRVVDTTSGYVCTKLEIVK